MVVIKTAKFLQFLKNTLGAAPDRFFVLGNPAYLHALPDIDLFVSTSAITVSPTVIYPLRFTTPSASPSTALSTALKAGLRTGLGTYTVWSRAYTKPAFIKQF